MIYSYSNLLNRKVKIKKNLRTNERLKYMDNFKIISINYKKCNHKVLGIDISISGIGFLSEHIMEKNDLVEAIFKYKNITIPATIKVNHINLSDKGYYIGGQFIALKNTYREILKHELL